MQHPCIFLDVPQVATGPTGHFSDDWIDRLHRFYTNNTKSDASPIWENALKPYKSLEQSLLNNQRDEFRKRIGTLYRSGAIWPLDIANESLHPDWLNKKQWFVNQWDGRCMMAGMSEGCFPVPNPEQPYPKPELTRAQAISRLEESLGIPLHCAGFGELPSLSIGKDKIYPYKLLEAFSVGVAVKRRKPHVTTCLEIGAGVGFTTVLMARCFPRAKFYTVDLPIIAVIQACNFAVELGEKAVILEGERVGQNVSHFDGGKRVEVSCQLPTCEFDLAVNINSLPEFPRQSAIAVLKRIGQQLMPDGLFWSVNHESSRGGQTRVFDLAREAGLRLIHRLPAWGPDRDHYVEESFSIA